MEHSIDIKKGNFAAIHTSVDNITLDGTPVLVVTDMKHGAGEKGSVGIFVDIGTEALISELKIICTD